LIARVFTASAIAAHRYFVCLLAVEVVAALDTISVAVAADSAADLSICLDHYPNTQPTWQTRFVADHLESSLQDGGTYTRHIPVDAHSDSVAVCRRVAVDDALAIVDADASTACQIALTNSFMSSTLCCYHS
jgi:hypothetical protein